MESAYRLSEEFAKHGGAQGQMATTSPVSTFSPNCTTLGLPQSSRNCPTIFGSEMGENGAASSSTGRPDETSSRRSPPAMRPWISGGIVNLCLVGRIESAPEGHFEGAWKCFSCAT